MKHIYPVDLASNRQLLDNNHDHALGDENILLKPLTQMRLSISVGSPRRNTQRTQEATHNRESFTRRIRDTRRLKKKLDPQNNPNSQDQFLSTFHSTLFALNEQTEASIEGHVS